MDIISKRYAESLFDLAKEEQAIAAYQKDMLKVQEIFHDENIIQFFSHVALQDQDKMCVMQKCMEGQVSTYVYNFLLLLIKKRRIKYIISICRCFEALCNEYFGIKVGKLWSAYQLTDEEIHKIENALSQKLSQTIQLRLIVDSSLIGGVKVEIDNHVYDGSLSYKLESLRQELLRK